MILLIDIGNTRLKWATLTADRFEFCGAVYLHDPNWMQALQEGWLTLGVPKRILAVNVGDTDITHYATELAKQKWHCSIEFITASTNAFGVINAYQAPKQLGIDRFVSLVAAWKRLGKALCIVSCGTCIVIDAIDDDGKHLGGWIVPGLALLQEAVIAGTTGCKDKKVDFRPSNITIANNTQDAISHGSLLMTTTFINQTINNLQKKLGNKMACLLSGGDANTIKPFLTADFSYEPHLVLQGVAEFK